MQFQQREHTINEIDGFGLVGSQKSHYWCGIWQTFGCLKHKTAYVKQYKRTCFRPECKTCYFSWASRQSHRAVKKISRMRNNNTVKHSILIQTQTWSKDTRKQLIKKLKECGVESACIIYTPFDESNNQKFFLKNTIHIFYTGIIRGNHYPQNDLDGTNKTLFKILQTQFLNVGLKKGLHHTSWIGKSIYCTLDDTITSRNGNNCPICNRKLVQIYYTGDKEKIPPNEYYNGETERDGWMYCFSESIWKKIIRKVKSFFSKCKGIIFLQNLLI